MRRRVRKIFGSSWDNLADRLNNKKLLKQQCVMCGTAYQTSSDFFIHAVVQYTYMHAQNTNVKFYIRMIMATL